MSNRQGRIGEGQKSTVETYRKGRVISLVAFGVMFAIFLLICLGGGIWSLLSPNGGAMRIALPIASGVGLLAISGGALNFFLRSRELIGGQVSQVEGPAKLSRRRYGGGEYGISGTALFVKIGTKELPLGGEEQFLAFEEGESYRAYFVKNYPRDVLLSVEAL